MNRETVISDLAGDPWVIDADRVGSLHEMAMRQKETPTRSSDAGFEGAEPVLTSTNAKSEGDNSFGKQWPVRCPRDVYIRCRPK